MGNLYGQKLEMIIKKYGCTAPDIADSKLINSIIIDMLTRRCAGKTVAIWGVGKKMQ